MHDLRKKILLESGKTASRKARLRPESNRASASHSPLTSPPSSRNNSRAGSRYASEDEGLSDLDFDDTTTISTNSASDDALDGDLRDPWTDRLQARVAELGDRKRSSLQGRVQTLTAYIHILRHHFAGPQIDRLVADIVGALLRSVKSGGSTEERLLALKAVAVTILTCPHETIFELVFPTLKTICKDAPEEPIKVGAIRAMSIAALYGSDSAVDAEEDMLQFMVEIIQSDGRAVDADDSSLVVVAALQAWGFVATFVDDLAGQAEEAMEAFVDQLDSSDSDVQTATGANIALLFEAAREHEKETGETLSLPYDPRKLVHRMNELARGSKSISKKDRRHVRSNFASIVISLELGKGPGYSTAQLPTSNPHTGGSKAETDVETELGYRQKIRVRDTVVVIDTWSLRARVETLKMLLGGGFLEHFQHNPTVMETLSNSDSEE